METPNVACFEKRPQATHRLFCFPYAGAASSAFRLWNPKVPQNIELCAIDYPGRVHLKTQCAESMEDLVAAILPQIQSLQDKPYSFYGHSFGSQVAFACAIELPQLQHLIVSGRRAPHLPNRVKLTHTLPDPEFLDAVQKQYGAIPEILLKETELLKLYLPSIKGDIKINEVFFSNKKLSLPLSVFYGTKDPSISTEDMEKWKEVTTGPFEIHSFDGGHFFIDTYREAFVKAVGDIVLS